MLPAGIFTPCMGFLPGDSGLGPRRVPAALWGDSQPLLVQFIRDPSLWVMSRVVLSLQLLLRSHMQI